MASEKQCTARATFAITVLMLAAAPLAAQAGEKKVKLADVPEAVRSAILKQVGDGRLVDIGTYEKDGRRVYEIEIVVGGKEFDVVFDADGKPIGKTFEGEKAEPGTERKAKQDPATDMFQDDFFLEDRQLTTTGRNRFFVLEPGYQLVLEGKDGEHDARLTITVLAETRKIGGFETRVVEERETIAGELVEVSRNFFAMCARTGSVFYFGEEVEIYEDGEVVRHDGAWLHGRGGARAGMMMPGEPIVGAAYQQETAPAVAMDRAKIAAMNVRVATPAGIFRGCLKVEEENPLDGEREFKIHAPGIGLVQDQELLLVRHGFVEKVR